MKKLKAEYIKILSQDINASEIFWELKERIDGDADSPGVTLQKRRSTTCQNIASLVAVGVIDFTDSQEFSKETQDTVRLMVEY